MVQDIFIRENEQKSNFSLGQIVDPIGLLGGKPIWDIDDKEGRAALKAYNQQKAQKQQMEQMMRDSMERDASSDRAYEIRREIKKGERSVKLKSGLIIGGIVLTTILIGVFTARIIIKKKG